jgi:capsular polysaccharide export protein
MIGLLSAGIAAIPRLEALLGEPWRRVPRWGLGAPAVDRVAGWGHGEPARRARAWARERGLPYLALEDGFVRSVGLGHVDPPLSLVTDDLGLYLDARAPSRLERLIGTPRSAAELARAERLVRLWRQERVSKYNHARDDAAPEGLPHAPFVLVADQVLGDHSIVGALADERSFARMLEAALDEHPHAPIVVKVHPDVVAGRKRGHFGRLAAAQAARVLLLGADVHPAWLLERACAVYTVSSQLGFEGLLWGRPVRTFGMPFYAGWGLTRDALPAPDRRAPASLGQLVHASLVDALNCIDPETGARCTVERLIEHLGLQRRMAARFPPRLHAVGFSRWKQPYVRQFLAGSDVRFVRTPRQAPADATLVLWGARHAELMDTRPALRLEDGFLRSVGLGANLVRPLSWTVDTRGIHYAAARTSDLERLLSDTAFPPALLARAARLRQRIVAQGVTKYAVDATSGAAPGAPPGWRRPAHPHVILVAGQVEGDASLAFGAPGIRTNLDLLRAVRAEAPRAWIVYKPHPDVQAGLRPPGADEARAPALCDAVVTDASLPALLRAVDEVHVLTSLAGFEALLRGVKVVTHGSPFYAGWGLSEDRVATPRRTRRLTLDELVAGALIAYPTYVGRACGHFTTPERVVDDLVAWRPDDAASPWWWRHLAARLVPRRRA